MLEDVIEAGNVDVIEARTKCREEVHMEINMEAQTPTQQEDESETLNASMGDNEQVTVNVSHADLTELIRPRSRQGTAEGIHFMGPKGEAKKMKEKALNDIKNKLDPWPAVLKSERVVMRLGSFKQTREDGDCLLQAQERPANNINGPCAFSFPLRDISACGAVQRVGQHETRPPDRNETSEQVHKPMNHKFPNLTREIGERVLVRQDEANQAGEENLMQEERWSDAQSD